MPVFPGQQQTISLDVPGPNTNAGGAGVLGSSISDLGQVITQGGLQIFDKMRQAEATDAVTKAYFTESYASEDYARSLKLKYPTGYVTDSKTGEQVKNSDGSMRTITHEYRDWADDQYVKSQNAMPSNIAKQLYKRDAGRLYNESLGQVHQDELKLRTETYGRTQDDLLRFSSNRLVSIPDVERSYLDYETLMTSTVAQKGVLLSDQQVHDRDKLYSSEIPQSLLKGMVTQAAEASKSGVERLRVIYQALAVIDGGVYEQNVNGKRVVLGVDEASLRRKQAGMSTWSERMDPDQKAQFREKFLSLIKIADDEGPSHWKQAVSATFAQFEREARDPSLRMPIPFRPLLNEGLSLLARKKITEFDFAETVGSLVARDQFNQLANDPAYLLAKPEQKRAIIQASVRKAERLVGQFASPGLIRDYPQVSSSITNKLSSEFLDLAKKSDELAHSDFVEFAQYSPSIKKDTARLNFSDPNTIPPAALIERSKNILNLGKTYFGHATSDMRFLSKKESRDFGDWIKSDLTRYSDVSAKLIQIKQSNPNVYATVIDQMVKDGNIPSEYRLALRSSFNEVTKEILRFIKDGERIQKNAFPTLTANGKKIEDFQVEMAKAANPALVAMARSSRTSLSETEISSMRNVLMSKALDLYRQENGARSFKDYADSAVKEFVGTSYTLMSTNGGFFGLGKMRDVVAVPHRIGELNLSSSDRQNFTLNQRYYLSPDGLKELGIDLPQGLPAILWPDYVNQVSNGRLDINEDHSGYYVNYYDHTFHKWITTPSTQKDNRGRPLPLVIPVDKILAPPSGERIQKQQKKLDEMKYLKKSFGGSRSPSGEFVLDTEARLDPITGRDLDIQEEVGVLNGELKDKGFQDPITYKQVEALWYSKTLAEGYDHISRMRLPEDRKQHLRDYIKSSFEGNKPEVAATSSGKNSKNKKYHVEVKRKKDPKSPTGYSSSIKQVFDE